MIKRTRGQSTAEYAVLFAIVLGAAIAMQQYVKSRIQGGVKGGADGYSAKAQALLGNQSTAPFSPDRGSVSNSATDIVGQSAKDALVTTNSTSSSYQSFGNTP